MLLANSYPWKPSRTFLLHTLEFSPIFPFCLPPSSPSRFLLAVRCKRLQIFLSLSSCGRTACQMRGLLIGIIWHQETGGAEFHPHAPGRGKWEKGTFSNMISHFFPNRISGGIIILEALYKQGCKCVFQGQGGLSCLVFSHAEICACTPLA